MKIVQLMLRYSYKLIQASLFMIGPRIKLIAKNWYYVKSFIHLFMHATRKKYRKC